MTRASTKTPKAMAHIADTEAASEPFLYSQRTRAVQLLTGSINARILIPYLLVILAIAVVGTFVIVRLVIGYLDQQVVNQLVNSIRESNSAMASLEDRQLESQRSIAFAEGLDIAVAQEVMAFIRPTVWRLQVIHQVPYVEVLNNRGAHLLSMKLRERSVEELELEPGIGEWQPVKKVLSRESDERGDMFADIVSTANRGYVLYTVGPIRNPTRENSDMEGVLLIGTPLDALITRLTQQLQVGVTIYDPVTGKILGSSLPYQSMDNLMGLSENHLKQIPIIAAEEGTAIRRKLGVGNSRFEEMVSTLKIRGEPTAVIGISVPLEPIEEIRRLFRDRFVVFFTFITIGLVAIGIAISRGITSRIKALIEGCNTVASGNLDCSIEPRGRDELGVLANSFNQMVTSIKNRYEYENLSRTDRQEESD